MSSLAIADQTEAVSRYTLVVIALVATATSAFATDSAWVAQINGAPTLTRAGATTALQRGAAVQVGDAIETDEAAKVKLLLADDSVLAIGPRSRVTLTDFQLQPQSRTMRLKVLAGRFKLAVSKFFSGPTDYEVMTPTAVAGVRGTVLWGDTDLDAICALDGSIKVRALKTKGAPVKLGTGNCVHEIAAGKMTPLKPSTADLAAYLKEVTLE